MTKRELYVAVIEDKVTDEVIKGFKGLVEGLDKTNAKRKDKKTKEQAETDEKVIAVMTTDFVKAKEISDKIEGFTTSRVVASCKRLEAEGKVAIKVETKGSRNISYYALVDNDNEGEAEE